MILFRKEPITIPTKNMMILDGSDNSYVYVSKSTYDQAVKLHSRFSGSVTDIWKFITAGLEGTNRPEIVEAINKYSDLAPVPISTLGSFFILLKDNTNIDWANLTEEEMYGYLHIMSQMLDFEAVTLVPSAVRATLSIPTLMLKSYKESWDDFLKSMDSYTIAVSQHIVQQVPAQNVMPVQTTVVQQAAPVQQATPTPAQSAAPTVDASGDPLPWTDAWMAEAVHMGGRMYQYRGEIFYKPKSDAEIAAKAKEVEQKVAAEQVKKEAEKPKKEPPKTKASDGSNHYAKPEYSKEEAQAVEDVLDEWNF